MKKLLHFGFGLLLVTAAVFASYQLSYSRGSEWLIVLLMALAPLLQFIFRWDRQVPMNAKLKQPLVSLLVMLGIAALLLLVPAPGEALWLGLAILGGYMLDTYWATEK